MASDIFINSPYLKKIWIVGNKDSIARKSTGNMVGDGRLELIFVSGNGYITKFGEHIETWGEGIYIGGHISQPFELEILPETQITFVKLEPWSGTLISGFDFRKSVNKTIPLCELNNTLYEKLIFSNGFAVNTSNLLTLNQFMENNLAAQKDFELIRFSAQYLETNFLSFKSNKKDLLHKINLSARSLETKFGRGLGLAPQKFTNTIRFRRIAEQIYHSPNATSLTDLAYKFGFYDQAHFIRLCNQYLGLSPSKLSKQNCFITAPEDHFRYYTI